MKRKNKNSPNLELELLKKQYEGIMYRQALEILDLKKQNEAILKSIDKKSESIDRRLDMLSKSMMLLVVQCLAPTIIVCLLLNK